MGRTGTYIALERLTLEGHSGKVDVLGCLAKMRDQRVNMVQTVVRFKLGVELVR